MTEVSNLFADIPQGSLKELSDTLIASEVVRIERNEGAGLAELRLRLEEAKQLTAALQAQIVPAQVTILSECRGLCVACGSVLSSKGHYPVQYRSLFGDVPLRVRRLLICPCQGGDEAT